MKRLLTILMIFGLSVVSVFAAEKSRTFGNCTLYFDTDNINKYYENPQKTTLENDLVIYEEVDAYIIEILKSGLADSALSEQSEDEQNFMQCIKIIIINNLAGGRIYYKKEKLWIYVFKDSECNLYYAN